MATWPSNPSLPSLALAKHGYAILVSELVEILMALLWLSIGNASSVLSSLIEKTVISGPHVHFMIDVKARWMAMNQVFCLHGSQLFTK